MTDIEYDGFSIPIDLAIKTGLASNFVGVSERHMRELEYFFPNTKNINVVEVGCCLGRDAIPLLKKQVRSYVGVDLQKAPIEWATKNITKSNPNFKFEWWDVANPQHNPNGKKHLHEYKIPVGDKSTDLIFLFSVFTHMYPKDVRYFFEEFRRILRNKNGRVVASFFLVNDDILTHLQKIGGGAVRKITLQHNLEEGFYVENPNVVPGATAYTMAKVLDLADQAGIKVLDYAKGGWSHHGTPTEGFVGQDMISFGL